jgi:succinate dehydrogenase / fumarate reductase cytochrome b subunit
MIQRVASLYRSSVGKKLLMAASGVILFGFIVLHMLGNLKIFGGAESLDGYARFLREVGYPAIPHQSALWATRILLLVALVVHAVAAFQTWAMSRNARPLGYRRNDDLSFSYASRTMRWGGVIILLFVVYHLLHFTTGQAHPDFVHGGVYHNFVVAFQNPVVLVAYLIAQAALCLHLYHGLWSATQTLGANHPKYNRLRRPAAGLVALAIFIGFVVPPVLVTVGVIS